MWNCSRRFWIKLSRVVNSIASLYGLGMIVYCLWVFKKWKEGTTGLPLLSFIAWPIFIHTCLTVGIALCLGSISCYIVVNCFSNIILCIYIAFIWCLLFLEVAIVVNVYFLTDWQAKIGKYIIDSEFESFVLFHLRMCRIIIITSLVPQVSTIALVSILRVVGMETISSSQLDVADFHQSFLVTPDSREPDGSE